MTAVNLKTRVCDMEDAMKDSAKHVRPPTFKLTQLAADHHGGFREPPGGAQDCPRH